MRLRFEDLVFSYPALDGAGERRALDGVGASIEPGELLVILGPNGAGKSTLVKVLSGLERVQSGRVCIGGEPIERLSVLERARRLAIVPQSLAAIPEVHVEDFVMGGRYAHHGRLRGPGPADVEAVREALEACDVAELGLRLLGHLSGGQRQRVLIARALAQEAPILLVDEPTSSLDPKHQLAVFELLSRLAARGRAIGVVTHELNLASQFADRILLMSGGQSLCEGVPEQVLVPEVLEPVYGNACLRFGEFEVGGGRSRPFVLPWRSYQEGRSDSGGG